MTVLNHRERELVALGAALGSNCVPCIEHHIPEARKAGLSDDEILQAVRLADKVRQVPAGKVLDVALSIVREAPPAAAKDGGCGCQAPREAVAGACCS